MSEIQKFDARQFGLQNKRLALVDLEAISDALRCIFSIGSNTLLQGLKSKYAFHIIPVFVTEGKFTGRKMAVVDADKAELAFKYIRDNADPVLLQKLKDEHEFELVPFSLPKPSGASVFAKCVRFVLGVGLMILLVSALTGCAEAPAEQRKAVEQGHVTFEQWGTVKQIEPVRKTKHNDYRRIVTNEVVFDEINVRSFPDGYVLPGDVIGQEVRYTENKVNIKLCKNGLCVAHSVCYRMMRCFEKYQNTVRLASNRESQ